MSAAAPFPAVGSTAPSENVCRVLSGVVLAMPPCMPVGTAMPTTATDLGGPATTPR